MSNLELAGFVNLNNGDLGKPVPAGQVWIPKEVWLQEGTIHWRGEKGRFRPISSDMLNRFIRLKDAESVLRFAKDWGVLALAEVPPDLALPLGEPKMGTQEDGEEDEPFPWIGKPLFQPCRGKLEEGSEPVAGWLYYARRAQAALNIAAALKPKLGDEHGKLGDLADWAQIGGFIRSGKTKEEELIESVKANIGRHNFGMPISIVVLYPETKIEDARNHLTSEIEHWFDCWKVGRSVGLSDFALRWSPEEGRWKVEYNYHGFLFPAIALQLALVVADADSLFSCSGCGQPYIRPRSKKRPKPGCRNYCDVCKEAGIAGRDATVSHRARVAQVRRLYAAGTSISQIAKQLETDVEHVSKWLQAGGKREKTKTRK
jgi:transposase-like protein